MSKNDTTKLLEIFNNPEFDAKRKADNLELLKVLTELVNKYPTLRFSQILQNYKFVSMYDENDPYAWNNEFYAEPGEILKRVQRRINDIENSEG